MCGPEPPQHKPGPSPVAEAAEAVGGVPRMPTGRWRGQPAQ